MEKLQKKKTYPKDPKADTISGGKYSYHTYKLMIPAREFINKK